MPRTLCSDSSNVRAPPARGKEMDVRHGGCSLETHLKACPPDLKHVLQPFASTAASSEVAMQGSNHAVALRALLLALRAEVRPSGFSPPLLCSDS